MASASVLTVEGVYLVDLEDGDRARPLRRRCLRPAARAGDASRSCPASSPRRVSARRWRPSWTRRPPLLVSHDAGRTWKDSGRGLPPGHAVAVSADDPDRLLYAARNRLYRLDRRRALLALARRSSCPTSRTWPSPTSLRPRAGPRPGVRACPLGQRSIHTSRPGLRGDREEPRRCCASSSRSSGSTRRSGRSGSRCSSTPTTTAARPRPASSP